MTANEEAPYQMTPENVERMKAGKAPFGKDGHPVELHHDGQKKDSPLKEMTRTDHRIGPNYKQNHQNRGQNPSNIDRTKFNKDRTKYWQDKAKQHETKPPGNDIHDVHGGIEDLLRH